MKSDAASGISGAAGTPLAHQAIHSGRDSKRDLKIKKSEAISDTLETSDREGDGKQAWNVDRQERETRTPASTTENGIDLFG